MQEKEIAILYEDDLLIVCVKPAGIASQGSGGFQTDLSDWLKLHIKKQTQSEGEPYLGIVHRLDQPVGGVMVYAKTQRSAAALCAQAFDSEAGMKKRYYAVLESEPARKSGTLKDYLLKDGRTNMSHIAEKGQKGAKLAELSYQILSERVFEGQRLWLAEVELKTGRHHQIRVQLANVGCPLYGDRKYHPSTAGCRLALFSHFLSFVHPGTKKRMEFDQKPEDELFSLFF